MCVVERDLSEYHSRQEGADAAYNNWSTDFSAEIKFLNKYTKNGVINIKDVREVIETFDNLVEEACAYEFGENSYDFSEDVQSMFAI